MQRVATAVATIQHSGASRVRTGDLSIANRTLYQLSYSPKDQDVIGVRHEPPKPSVTWHGMSEETEDQGGTLADAIAAHLALKREHGGDAEEIEHELEEALAPPTRDVEPTPEPAAEVAPEPTPPVEVPPEPAPSEPEEPIAPPPAPEPEPDPEPVAAEPDPEPEPEPTREPEPEPVPEPEPAPAASEQTETTGTIEFEWDKPAEEPEAQSSESAEHDLLEDTPDFFEETPEHDKLWFDEAPPRKFDF